MRNLLIGKWEIAHLIFLEVDDWEMLWKKEISRKTRLMTGGGVYVGIYAHRFQSAYIYIYSYLDIDIDIDIIFESRSKS